MSENSGIVKFLANIMSAKNFCSNSLLLGNQLARNVSVYQSVDSRCQCFKNENQRNAHFAAKRPRRPQDIFIEMSKLGRIHCHATSECLDMYFKYFCGTEMLSADNPSFTKERNDYLQMTHIDSTKLNRVNTTIREKARQH